MSVYILMNVISIQ